MKRLILELTLKPFRDISDDGVRSTCREILRQWHHLIQLSETISFLLFAADGSEILDYSGDLKAEFSYAKWIGIANGPWKEPSMGLHYWRFPYCENPPVMTYERLAFIVRSLKEESKKVYGKMSTVGAMFDPGPEFAESDFKYTRHPEINLGNTMGMKKWVHCTAVLNEDKHKYAGFPNGIPNQTSFGTFLGRQTQCFLKDFNCDYIWFGNGFAYALDSWSATGEVFDGTHFDTSSAPIVKEKILQFWRDFRKECPQYRIETRGSNLSTAMDLASDASPIRDIYEGNFNMVAPVNSPWAALNGDYGLEIVGWLSHIAELPAGTGVPFRYYIHDPWWLNSPWLDRYGREPHDIYLPLSVARMDAKGGIEPPASVALLTIDDSYGRMPEEVAIEVTPHIRTALEHYPDAPGLLTWVYPFDEYHDWTFGKNPRVEEVFFGDWFMRAAVNQGFPLNTVISTRNFLKASQVAGEKFNQTILVTPAPDGSELSKRLIEHVEKGGHVLLYGPLDHADQKLLRVLDVNLGKSVTGEFEFITKLQDDELAEGQFPRKFKHRELLCGGGINTIPAHEKNNRAEHIITVNQGNESRVFASHHQLESGGSITWVRGTLCEEIGKSDRKLKRDDPSQCYPAERFMRLVLQKLGYSIQFSKPSIQTTDPLILAARQKGGIFFSGHAASTNVQLRWKFPQGAPLPVGTDMMIKGGVGQTIATRAWHRECRIFVDQKESGEISCNEKHSGEIGIKRRMKVDGLKNATVTFLPEPGTNPTFIKPEGYWGKGQLIPTEKNSRGEVVGRNITGSLFISW